MKTNVFSHLAALIPLLPLSCTTADEGSSAVCSRGKCDSPGEAGSAIPTQPWVWSGEMDDEVSPDIGEVVDFTHPASERLQHWLDAADSKLRETLTQAMRSAPKPKAALVRQDRLNASVPRASVNLPLRTAGASGVATRIMANADGFIVPEQGILIRVERSFPDSTVNEIFHFLSEESGNCQLSLSGGQVEISGGCQVDPAIQNLSNTSFPFAFQATSRHVIVYTAFFQTRATEGMMLAPLFHELGHLYRAHNSISIKKHFEYFYSFDSSGAGRPQREQQYAAMTAQALAALAEGNWMVLNALEAQAAARHLGWYNPEHEADEFGLQVMALLGIDPQFMINNLLAMGPRECQNNDDAICMAQVERKCLDDSGQPLFVPWDFRYLHGPPCYRVWNARQWILRHPYDANDKVDLLSDDAWHQLQQSL